jgi:hypothetical protein
MIVSAKGRQKANAWIFQANPNRYRIEDSLQLEKQEFWNLNQHAKDIHSGDRVLVWISGSSAGIYALATVLSEPTLRPDSAKGLTYWRSRQDGQRPKPRVIVRYDKILLENPLLRVFLKCDPALWGLSILSQPRGTNFTVTEDEWNALIQWLSN